MRKKFDSLVSDSKTAVKAETLKRTSRAKYSTVFTHSDSRVMSAGRVQEIVLANQGLVDCSYTVVSQSEMRTDLGGRTHDLRS